MKPSPVHYFYAQRWPLWIWLVAVLSFCVLLMASALGPPPEITGFSAEAKSYLFLLGVSLLLGCCVAALLGPFILGPLYQYRAEVNGYPFQIGDRVEILVGANCGRVARVVEVSDWRDVLQVDLGEFAGPGARTFFAFAQVIKVSDADQAAPGDSPRPAGSARA